MRRTLLLLLLLIFCSVSSSADPAEVQLQLKVIGASNDGRKIDPALKEIHAELGSLFSFTSYRLFRDENLTLFPNQMVSIRTRKRSIELTLVGLKGNVAEIKIKVMRGEKEILNTLARLSPGRTLVIGGGSRETREGVIIYALYARF